ncbi:hypothetical protein [Pantoea rwandensis]|uniref:Uncharacterized protein n=1 Tax=Pantoea rwandensis TaxID=1076550 RepID=A0A1X1CQ81_9GAMM|nr:hypothetical protein [Pantoea rwandensis]ORM66586.1 hypothetical protein HA51_23440 [Pantoea rwandensis]
MQPTSTAFTVLNVSRFPMVTLNQQAVSAGYAQQWIEEMTYLLEQGTPFVMVYDHMRAEESNADRELRSRWLIEHRKTLSQICRGMISIESDLQRCEQLAKMRKLFGISHQLVSSEPYAMALIERWLA